MAKRLKNPVCRFHNESRCRLQHFRPEKYWNSPC
jgi:hypothetical protein